MAEAVGPTALLQPEPRRRHCNRAGCWVLAEPAVILWQAAAVTVG
jgi:hypothetical protein